MAIDVPVVSLRINFHVHQVLNLNSCTQNCFKRVERNGTSTFTKVRPSSARFEKMQFTTDTKIRGTIDMQLAYNIKRQNILKQNFICALRLTHEPELS